MSRQFYYSHDEMHEARLIGYPNPIAMYGTDAEKAEAEAKGELGPLSYPDPDWTCKICNEEKQREELMSKHVITLTFESRSAIGPDITITCTPDTVGEAIAQAHAIEDKYSDLLGEVFSFVVDDGL